MTGTSTFRNVADVDDPAANLVGIAAAASQGAVTAAQLDARPVMRAGEVLETVPGLIVSQHSGEGKANQYYLRGFNLDHGTDFSTTVAGVPVNTPTGAHAHGYADVSFLIPELVSGVQFKKGPYFADEGDFSAAGAANINYVNQLERPMVRLSAGSDGWGRLFGAASPRVGGGYLLGALEVNHNDGPWVRPDDYQKVNGVLRYSRGDNRNGFSLTGMGYRADWDATRPGARARDRERADSAVWIAGSQQWRQANRQSVAAEFQRSDGPSSLASDGLSAPQQPQPVLELHLLPGRPGATAISSSRPSGASPQAVGSPTVVSGTSSIGTPKARSACNCVVTGSTRWACTEHRAPAAHDDARGRSRSDDGGRVRANRDRMDAGVPHDVRAARRPLPVLGHLGQPR